MCPLMCLIHLNSVGLVIVLIVHLLLAIDCVYVSRATEDHLELKAAKDKREIE